MLKIAMPAVLLMALTCVASAQDDVARMLGIDRVPVALSGDEGSERLVILHGTVEAIDPANRLVVLQAPTGSMVTIYAGDEVAGFEHLRFGERATVRYAEPLLLAIARNGVFGKRALAIENGFSPLSEKAMAIPAERMRALANIFGKISRLDLRNSVIAITAEDGRTLEMRVPGDDSMRDLRVGERVLATYLEATAISVQAN